MAHASGLEERAPHPYERLLTTVAAANLLKISRQAVDKGLRTNRIPGFRNIEDNTLYVSRDYVEARLDRNNSVSQSDQQARALRIAELEQQVQALQNDQLARAQADAATLRDVNLLLLAAADEQALATTAANNAARHLRKHRKQQQLADEHVAEAQRLYREAIKQHQLPDMVPADLGPL